MEREVINKQLEKQVELLIKLFERKFMPVRLRLAVFDRLLRLLELLIATDFIS